MGIVNSPRYKTAFRIAGVIVPLLMGAAGLFYGDIEPVVRDACEVLLPKGSVIRPSVTIKQGPDAGAVR